jgi:hypothetical protein
MERARGTFVRSLRLPFSADANQVQASFKDGILSITIPKPQEARERVQRIEVKRDESGGNQRSPSGSQSSSQQKAPEQKVPETAAE